MIAVKSLTVLISPCEMGTMRLPRGNPAAVGNAGQGVPSRACATPWPRALHRTAREREVNGGGEYEERGEKDLETKEREREGETKRSEGREAKRSDAGRYVPRSSLLSLRSSRRSAHFGLR